MARKIVVEFLGNDRSLGSTATAVERKTSTLGDRLKTFGKVAAAGFAIAGAAAVKFGLSSIDKASDLNETISKSETIFGKNFATMDRWAKGAATSMGLSREAALSASAGFGDMFGQLGFAGGEASKMSRDVVQLSADLGSFNNLETSDVADRMAAAFRGEYDSLQALIPNINAARVETQALAMTGKKSAAELTAQEKAAATLAIVQKDGARAAGDFARTSDGLANQQKILRAQFENVQASIGQKLLPVAVKLAQWANDDMIPAIKALGRWFNGTLLPAFDNVRAKVTAVFGGMRSDVSGPLADVRSIIRDFVSIVRSLWARFGHIITDYVQTTFKNIKPMIGGALKVISGIFRAFAALLKGDWRGLWAAVKKIISGAMQLQQAVVRQALNVLKTLFRLAWSAVKGIVAGAWDGIKALARNGADWLVDAIRAIPGRLASLGGRFATAGKALLQDFIDGMKNAAGIISGIAGNVWDAVRGLLNGAINKINAALEFRISVAGKGFTINPPDIPQMYARGTNRHPGGLAIVGEEGPELVDLPRGSRVHSASRTKAMAARGPAGGGDGDQTVVVPVVIEGKVIEQVLIRFSKKMNRPLQIRTLGPA